MHVPVDTLEVREGGRLRKGPSAYGPLRGAKPLPWKLTNSNGGLSSSK